MEIIKPPTDNLYKFLAISGLAILVISIIYPVRTYFELRKQLIEFNRDLTVLKIELNDIKEIEKSMQKSVDKNREAYNSALDAYNKFMKSQISKETVLKSLDDISYTESVLKSKIKELKQNIQEWEKKKEEINYREELLNLNMQYANILGILAIVGNILGILITSLGFILWYRKVQRYQDSILLNEAKYLEVKKND